MEDIHNLIVRHQTEILQNWAGEAQHLASARGLSRPELMNILPRYLSALAPLDGTREVRRREIESHLSARLRAGYRLDEVLEELAMLGRCVVRACADEASDASRADALARIYDALHEDASVVIGSFMEYLNEDEQEEKLYLRRLQNLAGSTLREGLGGPEREGQLKAIIELVMEAVGAQSAAILLYQKANRSLWMTASAGVAEPLARYAAEMAGSFVAEVAAHEEVTAILDVETTELEVSETLRRSGTHALLGVRLPSRNELVGVMYVGVTERRSFSTRQVRRLETLGEQLSLHLDRARIYDELRTTIEHLRSEHELRERFISVLAHDLRGPLTVVRTSAHLLCRDGAHLGDHSELPGRVLRNVLRADRMIHDLLDVLRVRAGHGLPLTFAECDLAEVARETVDELVALYGDRFVLRCAARVRGVWCADALHRVLWNLATNAVKYGAPEVPVLVTVRRLDEVAELSVHNEGGGDPAADARRDLRAFRPFLDGEGERRTPGVRARAGDGQGLRRSPRGHRRGGERARARDDLHGQVPTRFAAFSGHRVRASHPRGADHLGEHHVAGRSQRLRVGLGRDLDLEPGLGHADVAQLGGAGGGVIIERAHAHPALGPVCALPDDERGGPRLDAVGRRQVGHAGVEARHRPVRVDVRDEVRVGARGAGRAAQGVTQRSAAADRRERAHERDATEDGVHTQHGRDSHACRSRSAPQRGERSAVR